jgi:hypothetical protein
VLKCRRAFLKARGAVRPQVADAAAGAGADAGGEEVSLVAGRLQVDVAATNLQPVPLALLKVTPRAPPGVARAGPARLRPRPPQAGHGRGAWRWVPVLHGAGGEALTSLRDDERT